VARVCVVGNATKDVNETGLLAERRPGGTLLYASLALDRLGHEVHPIGYAPLTAYLTMRRAGLPMADVRLALRPTKFKNTYDGLERTQHARPGPSRALDGTDVLDGYEGILLGPVLGEIPADLPLPDEALTLLDVQGFVRSLGSRDMWGWREVANGEPSQGLPAVDVIRGSIDELSAWLGTDEPREAARALRSRCSAMAVVTMGSEGALARDGTEHRARPTPIVVEDPTGAGDVFDAALVHGLLELSDAGEALAFASGAAAAFLDRPGGIEIARFPTRQEAAEKAPSRERP
jgi:sugar/nucleoside kinase (ribokinase family)